MVRRKKKCFKKPHYPRKKLVWENWSKQKHTAISRKVVGKNVHVTIPKGNMGYDQYTVPDTVAVKTSLLLSLNTRKHTSTASYAILSNFFEEQWTQNHPQYLSWLSRTLFPTTFLEIAVYACTCLHHSAHPPPPPQKKIWSPSPWWPQIFCRKTWKVEIFCVL